jgi:hypothetical protein
MSMIWHNSPGSRQHWLYVGPTAGEARRSAARGMVYEVGPAAFTVYQDRRQAPWGNREFITQMETLDEAKGLLQTLVGAEV